MTRKASQAVPPAVEGELSPAEISALRALLERQAILDVVNNYFYALDARDFELLTDVFTVDAQYEATLVDGTQFSCKGREAIVSACRQSQWRVSHHGARNHAIRIDGDRAFIDIFAMEAALTDKRNAGDLAVGPRLYQHGLRYFDTFEKADGVWRIAHRRLFILWQQMTFNPPVLADPP